MGKGARRISSLSRELSAPLRPGPAAMAMRCGGVVFGVAIRAQHRQKILIRRVVGEMGNVQEAVRLAAALADVAGGHQHAKPKLAPAGLPACRCRRCGGLSGRRVRRRFWSLAGRVRQSHPFGRMVR